MEHHTDAPPADDVQPAAKPRCLWSAPKLTVMPLAHVTRGSGNTILESIDSNTHSVLS